MWRWEAAATAEAPKRATEMSFIVKGSVEDLCVVGREAGEDLQCRWSGREGGVSLWLYGDSLFAIENVCAFENDAARLSNAWNWIMLNLLQERGAGLLTFGRSD
ncbi:hypothetical protein V494_06380 [Pseudogymnoascus sp. VKM F-4513 (FW-928)]|nr:hypothetical protein V494_06380 [Pseudogymnoascus sp. VKM F-4513 (FW-928)]